MSTPEYEYAAFVSYRHLDATEPGQQWAAWVQTLLERYTTPPELAGQQSLYGDPVPDKMERVFRDKDQLPAHGDLGALIHDALDKSRVLIVLCTPSAVASPWVADEILHFKKLGRADRIISIVLRGEPHAPDPRNECYPQPLRHKLHPDGTLNLAEKEHPIYIDLRPPLGTTAATSPEDYRAVLHAADLYKDGPIEAAVTKYTSQLEEARILLLGGALGLTPRELTQRDLLRRIEEEKTRAAEEKKRAEWEAEQKHIAETARTEAERQRKRATTFSKVAAFAAILAGLLAIFSFLQRESANQAREKAEQARNYADEQKARAVRGEADALAAKSKATTARAAADKLVRSIQSDLNERLPELERLDVMKVINERVSRYQEQHPPDPTDASANNKADYEQSAMLNKRGDAAAAELKLDVALTSYQMALQIIERLAKRDPRDTDCQRDLSLSHHRIGDIQKAKGDQDGALISYQKSLEIRERLAKEDPGNVQLLRDISVSLERIGATQQKRFELDASLISYQKSLEIHEQAAKQDPKSGEWPRNVSLCYSRLAEIYQAKNERGAALVHFQKSLEISERLAHYAPDNSQWQRDHIANYNRIGEFHQRNGERDAAISSFQKSLKTSERLSKLYPDDIRTQVEIATRQGIIANLLIAKDDLTEAEKLIHEGIQRLDMLEKRVKPDEDFKAVRALLLSLQSQLPKDQ